MFFNDDQQRNSRRQLWNALREKPIKAFDMDVSDTTESENDDIDCSSGKTNFESDGPVPTLDELFDVHAQFLRDIEEVSPVYQEYSRWGVRLITLHTRLEDHLNSEDQKMVKDTKQDPFSMLQTQSKQDLFKKEGNQIKNEIKQLQDLQKRFLEDIEERTEKIGAWQNNVKEKWRHVLPQLLTHGARLTPNVQLVFAWLHNQKLISRNHQHMYAITDHVLATMIPYTKWILFIAYLYHMIWWSSLQFMWQYYFVLVGLYQAKPFLRNLQLSPYHIRTDILVGSLILFCLTTNVSLVMSLWGCLQMFIYCMEYIGS